MALKLRKDIKKSSYYVWFLGAKESKGLRGPEFVLPVIQHLEEREKDVEPFKVTLQVSHKGLKIIQNVVSQGLKSSKPKNETIKHFIPHNTITCVYQKEDVIACILLLFNPVTKCPLHVHAYRCDSLETATLLKQQLQTLIERPENQKKFSEIENRLKGPKESKKFDSSVGSDTGNSTRESESSEERFGCDTTRVATLYDSVAAELRAKLGKNDVPILLPPRDYDTVHRQKGNLTGIELRRCLNANIVGQNAKVGRKIDSSGGSSGIGSDHAPSPDSPDATDTRFNSIDNHSTSDEEWGTDLPDTSIYLMHTTSHVTLPRPSRNHDPSNSPDSTKSSQKYEPDFPKYIQELKHKNAVKQEEKSRFIYNGDSEDIPKKYLERTRSRDTGEIQRNGHKYAEYDREDFREDLEDKRRYLKEGSKGFINGSDSYRSQSTQKSRFHDGFEDDQRYQREKTLERSQRYPYEDDFDREDSRYSRETPVPKTRQKYPPEEKIRYYQEEKPKQKFKPDDPRFYQAESPKVREKYSRQSSLPQEETLRRQRLPENRQRSPSPQQEYLRDRFKEAREKFMQLERERLQDQRRMKAEMPITPVQKDKTFLKRHESLLYPKERSLERYYEDRREEERPKPAPRSLHSEEVRFRSREVPLERYRNSEKFEPKRRSMFNLAEEEHRKNSSEIAKELKRRSYMESNNHEEEFARDKDHHHRSYIMDLPESDRYIERDSYHFSKSSVDLDKVEDLKFDGKFLKNQKVLKNSAGYRHSYAEPKLRVDKSNGKKHFNEMLHRTNSSVSNGGRVGIASVHPY